MSRLSILADAVDQCNLWFYFCLNMLIFLHSRVLLCEFFLPSFLSHRISQYRFENLLIYINFQVCFYVFFFVFVRLFGFPLLSRSWKSKRNSLCIYPFENISGIMFGFKCFLVLPRYSPTCFPHKSDRWIFARIWTTTCLFESLQFF